MVRVLYRGQWVEFDITVAREFGGQLTGLAAQLLSVGLDVVWPGVDVRRLEGARAEVDGVACRVSGAAVEGGRVTATLEAVPVLDGGILPNAGVTQDRWPVSQVAQFLPLPPYYERVRTGPPEASVGVSYPVVIGAPGAWVDDAGEHVTGEGSPVVVVDSDSVEVTRTVQVAEADGTSAYVTITLSLPHRPISTWPITLTTRIGGLVAVGLIDGSVSPVFSGALIAGTWDQETQTLSATWDGVPDAGADITAAWTAATWRGVLADELVEADQVMVGGVLADVRTVEDGAGQSLPIVWLGGAGSTDVPVWNGSALTAAWVGGAARAGGLGSVLAWLARRSAWVFDSASLVALAELEFLRVDLVVDQPTPAVDVLTGQLLSWAPVLVVEGTAGLVMVPMLDGDGVEVNGYQVGGETVAEIDSVGRVVVRWAGGVVERVTGAVTDAALELDVPTADRATAEWVASWWARWRQGPVVQVEVVSHVQLRLGQWCRWGGRRAVVIGQVVAESGAAVWRLWLP